MIQKYKTVSIIYGGKGKEYANELAERISDLAENERYPLQASIIMERLLTRELLSDVISLFKESEFCVAFLTSDDCYSNDDKKIYRLRQNVIFELGMALIEIGRERCILLSDFDAKSAEFDLPSDMNSLEIRQFDKDDFQDVLKDVLMKILELSRSCSDSHVINKAIPQYDKLLLRERYYVDYENVFELPFDRKYSDGNRFLIETLNGWLKECNSLPHYDEKAMYLFERIGFLPIFGKIPEAKQWLEKSFNILGNYSESDIEYYDNRSLLDFIRHLVRCIIEYTQIKTNSETIDFAQYKRLLESFIRKTIPSDILLNPLVCVVYYDYLGLTYMKLYNGYGDREYIVKAQTAFEKALYYADKVDLGINVWHGFINYNLARAYALQGKVDLAEDQYCDAISIRENWLKTDGYNVIVRTALSSEYFIAKIDYISMCRKYNRKTEDEIIREYDNIEVELNAYCDVEDSLEQLQYVRKLLDNKRKKD